MCWPTHSRRDMSCQLNGKNRVFSRDLACFEGRGGEKSLASLLPEELFFVG